MQYPREGEHMETVGHLTEFLHSSYAFRFVLSIPFGVALYLWFSKKTMPVWLFLFYFLSAFLSSVLAVFGIPHDIYVTKAVSVFMLLIFAVGNLHNAGISLLIFWCGAFANTVAKLTNGMRMPVFVKDVFLENADYTLMSFMTSFNFLGDWIPGPFGNIISMGDVLLALGCALMIPETRARQNR